MTYLNKDQTKFIQAEIIRRGITMKELEVDLLDYLCSAVENEMADEPNFERAYQKVFQTLKPNELKMAQEKTQQLLENKVSLLQKTIYMVLFTLLLSVLGYMINLPWAGEIISISIVSLIGLYIYSNLRWYFRSDGRSKRQKGVILLGAFLVFLFIISVIFKMYHYPGAGILMTSSLAILIFLPVFMSIFFFIKGKTSDTHVVIDIIKKNRRIAELVLLSIFFLGFCARLLIIDFFGNMFIISTLFCFAFLFITYTWPVLTSSIEKIWKILLLLSSTIAYSMAIVAGLFKIMNWPFPYLNFALNLPYIIMGLMSCIWYGVKIYEYKNVKSILLFALSLILFSYALLLFNRISNYPALEQSVYNVPVLVAFILALIVFYKRTLFRVVATCLLGYYLLTFPYKEMPNKTLVKNIYSNDPMFLDLYEKSIQNPQDNKAWRDLIEYNYNKMGGITMK